MGFLRKFVLTLLILAGSFPLRGNEISDYSEMYASFRGALLPEHFPPYENFIFHVGLGLGLDSFRDRGTVREVESVSRGLGYMLGVDWVRDNEVHMLSFRYKVNKRNALRLKGGAYSGEGELDVSAITDMDLTFYQVLSSRFTFGLSLGQKSFQYHGFNANTADDAVVDSTLMKNEVEWNYAGLELGQAVSIRRTFGRAYAKVRRSISGTRTLNDGTTADDEIWEFIAGYRHYFWKRIWVQAEATQRKHSAFTDMTTQRLMFSIGGSFTLHNYFWRSHY